MTDSLSEVIDKFRAASTGFGRRLEWVRTGQWASPTPCTEWTIRQLVNHMVQGNLNYVRLVHGAAAREFLRLRDADALGPDPVAAYVSSVRDCAAAFAEPGALERVLDYPLGRVPGRQALAVRTTDTVIHTWDLARAAGLNDTLDAGLVTWIDGHLRDIYADLTETPIAAGTTHRFFAAPVPGRDGTSRQDRLLQRMGRTP